MLLGSVNQRLAVVVEEGERERRDSNPRVIPRDPLAKEA
jgi:hypothetical protein